MADWVRTNTNQVQVTDADLTGALDLDNPTAPVGFDPAGVTGVRFQLAITGAGFVDDSWTAQRSASLSTSGTAPNPDMVLGFVNFANVSGLANTTDSFDLTDSAPNNALTTADWENSDVVSSGTAGTSAWATLQKTKGADGATLTIPVGDLTVTITYTPSSGVNLAGTAAGASTASGVLSGEVPLTGSAAGSSTGVGLLSAEVSLVGTAAGGSGAAGVLSGEVPLAAVAAGSSTADGNLTVTGGGEVLLVGTAAGSSTAQGVLSGEVPLVGDSAGSSTADGNLIIEGTVNLAGITAGVSTASGVLTADVGLEAVAAGASTADGTLTVEQLDVFLIGSADGVSTAVGILTALIPLVASSAGTSTAAGVLSIPSPRKRLEGHRVAVAALEGHRTRQ